jgi:hypothetical protein
MYSEIGRTQWSLWHGLLCDLSLMTYGLDKLIDPDQDLF